MASSTIPRFKSSSRVWVEVPSTIFFVPFQSSSLSIDYGLRIHIDLVRSTIRDRIRSTVIEQPCEKTCRTGTCRTTSQLSCNNHLVVWQVGIIHATSWASWLSETYIDLLTHLWFFRHLEDFLVSFLRLTDWETQYTCTTTLKTKPNGWTPRSVVELSFEE